MIEVATKHGGMEPGEDGSPKLQPAVDSNYGQSKAGNIYLAKYFRDELKKDGILSICFNPGNVNDRNNVQHAFECSDLQAVMAEYLLLHPLVKGAYTELWAGLTPELTLDDSCIYEAPWGRKGYNRWDIEEGLKGDGPRKSAEWCASEKKAFR